MAYEYKNPNRARNKKDCLALCMKVDDFIYFGTVSSTFNHKSMRITSVKVHEADSIVIKFENMEPYGEYVVVLGNVDFSTNPMCFKIAKEYEEYYSNSSEYVLK